MFDIIISYINYKDKIARYIKDEFIDEIINFFKNKKNSIIIVILKAMLSIKANVDKLNL